MVAENRTVGGNSSDAEPFIVEVCFREGFCFLDAAFVCFVTIACSKDLERKGEYAQVDNKSTISTDEIIEISHR